MTRAAAAPARGLAVAATAALALGACRAGAPVALGPTPPAPGSADACPASPNCVSSLAPAGAEEHHAAPLSYAGTAAAARAVARSIIEDLPRAAIVRATPDYLHATFTSRIFRFVDDVELWFYAAPATIHVRSASRVGHSDLGVNRRRVDDLRQRLAAHR